MLINIIAIGNEILKGSTVNTNAAFISRELRCAGYQTNLHLVLPDDPVTLAEELKLILNKSDVVITCGGLGPTIDDLTKKIVAEMFDSELAYNEMVANDLKKRYANLPSLEEQSTVPTKAKVMINTVGTAPGFIFHHQDACLFVFPGVPKELEAMFLQDGLPYLQKAFPLKKRLFMESIHVCKLPEVYVDQILRRVEPMDEEVELGIYPSLGLVHVTFTVHTETEEEAKEKIKPLKEAFSKELTGFLYESSSGSMEEALHRVCIEQNKTLAFAESCTGGKLAARITAMKDASKYFMGSIVSYSNDVKQKVLEVSSKTLEEHGAVSESTVREMVVGVQKLTGAELAAAVSGIAGPDGGTKEKPVGTVYIAFFNKGEIFSGCIHAKGDRASVIEYAGNFVFSTLWQMLEMQKVPEFL